MKRINVKILVMYLIAIGINCMFILKGNAADLKCMANYKDPLTKQKVSEKIADVADDLDSTSACAKACKKFEEENPDAQLVYCHNRT